MSVQIGSIIKVVMEEKKVNASDLASRLGVHPGSISRIFTYKHMHSSLLQKISQALGHDFFKYFSQDIRVERPMIDWHASRSNNDRALINDEAP